MSTKRGVRLAVPVCGGFFLVGFGGWWQDGCNSDVSPTIHQIPTDAVQFCASNSFRPCNLCGEKSYKISRTFFASACWTCQMDTMLLPLLTTVLERIAKVLTGECTFNGKSIPTLRLCDIYRDWLREQLEKHRIPYKQIEAAAFEVQVVVKDVNLRSSYGHRFALAHFLFDCRSEIKTDEKSYDGQMAGDKEWGFDWYYEPLYVPLPDVLPTTTC